MTEHINSLSRQSPKPVKMRHAKRRRKNKFDTPQDNTFLRYMGPWICVVAIAITVSGLSFRHPLGWGSMYKPFSDYTPIIAYAGSIVVGIVLTKIVKIPKTFRLASPPLNQINKIAAAITIAVFVLFILKFVAIGDVPLIGNPSSRYHLKIGGYADYLGRLSTPLAIYWFAVGIANKYGSKLPFVFAGISAVLNLLYTQRQDVLYIGLGIGMVYLFRRKFNLKGLIVSVLVLFLLLYLVVGILGIVRFGGKFHGFWSYVLMPIWIIIGELSVPYRLGNHVHLLLGETRLHGIYSYGTELKLLGLTSTNKIGAEYINLHFVGNTNAQSVAAPYSYMIDFGFGAIFLFGIVSGIVLGYLHQLAILHRYAVLPVVVYVYALLIQLWSIRSGNALISINLLLPLGALFIVDKNQSGDKSIFVKVITGLFGLVLLFGFVNGIMRGLL